MYQEEFEAVNSLFCLPGECVYQDNRLAVNTLVEHSGLAKCVPVQIVFVLQTDYPTSVPQISILSGNLNRDLVTRVKAKSLNCCESLLGEPMLISLISTIQENIREELDSQSCDSKNDYEPNNDLKEDTNIWTSILRIDHMRSPSKYCKTLEKWASELSLNGVVIFFNKLILVILQGEIEDIKDFIVRLKTVSVDVDSKGHGCKERMMSVLCEKQIHLTRITKFIGFERKQFERKEELKTLFIQAGLEELYNEHVTRLQGGHI